MFLGAVVSASYQEWSRVADFLLVDSSRRSDFDERLRIVVSM